MCSRVMGSATNDPLRVRDLNCCEWSAIVLLGIPALILLIPVYYACVAIRWAGKKLRIPVDSQPAQTV